jgi:hypothetical protein
LFGFDRGPHCHHSVTELEPSNSQQEGVQAIISDSGKCHFSNNTIMLGHHFICAAYRLLKAV